MNTIRRLYLYLMAFAGLASLLSGISLLTEVFLRLALSATTPSHLGSEISQDAALALVGLPVWLVHWLLAERAARRDSTERGSTLRRLYLYGVLLATALTVAVAAQSPLEWLFALLVDRAHAPTAVTGLRQAPWVLFPGIAWAYHQRLAARDRAAVGEQGGSATLRRWHTYILAFTGLALFLFGAADLLRFLWEVLTQRAGLVPGQVIAVRSAPSPVPQVAARMVVGLCLWLGWRRARLVRLWQSGRGDDVLAQDGASILLPVYLFLALGLSVAMSLAQERNVLGQLLERALGGASAATRGESLWLTLGGPISLLLVFGVSWLYQRYALAVRRPAAEETPRQAGIRRLYVYLVLLTSLALYAAGLAQLLWGLVAHASGVLDLAPGRERWLTDVSWGIASVVAGLPVWLAYWRRAAGRRAIPAEVTSLSRRLYVYVALLGGALALLGWGTASVKHALDLALGEGTGSGLTNGLAESLCYVAVAALVVFYHQRVLRADLRARDAAAVPVEAAGGAGAPAPAAALGEQANGTALASLPAPRYGVVQRSAGEPERVAWFEAEPAALAAYQAALAAARDGDWVALLKVEAQNDGQPA